MQRKTLWFPTFSWFCSSCTVWLCETTIDGTPIVLNCPGVLAIYIHKCTFLGICNSSTSRDQNYSLWYETECQSQVSYCQLVVTRSVHQKVSYCQLVVTKLECPSIIESSFGNLQHSGMDSLGPFAVDTEREADTFMRIHRPRVRSPLHAHALTPILRVRLETLCVINTYTSCLCI